MDHNIKGNSVSETIYGAFKEIRDYGIHIGSRNGGATSIYDATLEVFNPRSRHLNLNGRKSNIFQMIAETFWVMAGDNRISPYLEFFLPRAANYSDDGIAWHGAYGKRFYMYDQVQNVIRTFKEDGLNTRRAFIQIAMPEMDSYPSIEGLYGADHKAKDIPCNREIHFYVVDGAFNAKTIQRSGDVLFGAGSINPFEFSFLQELIYNELTKDFPDLTLGSYKWHVTNLHVYDDFAKQLDEALEDDVNTIRYDDTRCTSIVNNKPLIAPPVEQWKEFFTEIVEAFSDAIVTENERKVLCMNTYLGIIFYAYDVPMQDNLLWDYCMCVLMYIAQKKNISVGQLNLADCDVEFTEAIIMSPFRKFDLTIDEEEIVRPIQG